MKALVHWAIYRQQKIRIAGRSDGQLWGKLIGPDGAQQSFHFDQRTSRLILGEGESQRVLQLDAYGFERQLDASGCATSTQNP
jgi:hypothetical protein